MPKIGIAGGPCAQEILEEVKVNNTDVVVMGTHGHSLAGEIVMGSVTHKVIHKNTIPVLMVPFATIAGGD